MDVEKPLESATTLTDSNRWHISFVWLFLLGFLVRAVVAPFTEHQFDVGTYKNMAILAYSLQVNPLYYWSYGPVWLYMILGVYPFYLVLSFLLPSELLLNFIIKLPLIASDLLLAYCLYYLSHKVTGNQRLAKIVAAGWLFNPYVIFVSSVHGMFDQLPALFALLSLTLLLNRRFKLSAVSLAIAFSLKLYVILTIPFLILPIAKKKVSQALSFLAVFGGTTLLVYLPYLLDTHTLDTLVSVYFGYAGFGKFLGYPVGLASFIHYTNLPSPLVFIVTNQFFTMLLPALLALTYYLWKKRQLCTFDLHIVNRNIAVVLLICFLAYQFVHAQFIVWVLPFLLIAHSVSHKLRGWLYHSIWLSMFMWYLFQGVQTFVSVALIPATSWGQTPLTARIVAVSYLSDAIFVISSILCIASLLSWRTNDA